MRKTLLYYIFNKEKKPLYIDANGNEQQGSENYQKPDGSSAHLQFAPDGWRDTLVKYARNIKYWGLFRDFTVPMKFVVDGAKILSNRMWKHGGAEAVAHLGIMKLDKLNFPHTYHAWYLCELNFAKFKELHDGVSIEALEGGASKYLKANENTTYEVPCDEVNILFDGMEFLQAASWGIIDGYTTNFGFGQHTVNLTNLTREAFDAVTASDVQRTRFDNNSQLLSDAAPFLVMGNSATAITVSFRFGVTVNIADGISKHPAAGSKLFVREFDQDNAVVEAHLLYTYGGNNNLYRHHDIAGEVTFTAQANSRLYLIMVLTIDGQIQQGSGADHVVQWIYDDNAEMFFNANYSYKYRPSMVRGILPYTLVSRLFDKMSGGLHTVKSEWLRAMKDIVLVCGDSLRGIENAVIKTNLNEFFKAFDSRWGAGVGIENDQLVIERIKYFFSDAVIANLGVISKPELNVLEELFFNKILAGYEKQDYTDVNGRNEVNQGQQWTTSIKKTIQDLDKKSPYRADAIGMELIRINFEKKKTTDSTGDYDTFLNHATEDKLELQTVLEFIGIPSAIMYMKIAGNMDKLDYFAAGMKFIVSGGTQDGEYTSTGAADDGSGNLLVSIKEGVLNEVMQVGYINASFYRLYRPAMSVTGIPFPESAFNLLLNPRQGILENGPYIRSILDQQDATLIELASGDRNTELKIDGVSQKDSIQVGALGDRLFLPYTFDFKTEVPISLVELMKANPYGKIQFQYRNRNWFGYLFDGGLKPATMETQTWKLLAAPENDLSKFNHG